MRVFRWIEWLINVKETTKHSLHSILVKVLYDISNVTNPPSPKTLKRSTHEASTRPDETIISNTADHVSKFCRLSNYSDFLRAPFSTLKKSIANKNRNSTLTNETKKTEIVKVTENHEANIDYLNSGEYSIQYRDNLIIQILKRMQHLCKNVFII